MWNYLQYEKKKKICLYVFYVFNWLLNLPIYVFNVFTSLAASLSCEGNDTRNENVIAMFRFLESKTIILYLYTAC